MDHGDATSSEPPIPAAQPLSDGARRKWGVQVQTTEADIGTYTTSCPVSAPGLAVVVADLGYGTTIAAALGPRTREQAVPTEVTSSTSNVAGDGVHDVGVSPIRCCVTGYRTSGTASRATTKPGRR